MNSLCDINNSFFASLDKFGKTPEFYFERKSKKSSLIGIIGTFIYIFIYIGFCIYKFCKMIKRDDGTFYDTYSYEEMPTIELTNDIFDIAFSINQEINESLYIPEVQFVDKESNSAIRLKAERCKIKDSDYYCIKNISGLVLKGNYYSETYSMLGLRIYPCYAKKFETCQSNETIYNFFSYQGLYIKYKDIIIKPDLYSSPIQPIKRTLINPVYNHMFTTIQVDFKITIIETESDIFGLDLFSKKNTTKFLTFDNLVIISELRQNNLSSLIDVAFQLSSKILTIKRKYVTLIDVLGDIGGFMEIIFFVLNIISSFFADSLYEKSL